MSFSFAQRRMSTVSDEARGLERGEGMCPGEGRRAAAIHGARVSRSVAAFCSLRSISYAFPSKENCPVWAGSPPSRSSCRTTCTLRTFVTSREFGWGVTDVSRVGAPNGRGLWVIRGNSIRAQGAE